MHPTRKGQKIMKQEPIIFKQGEENGIVIERENFKSSIFVDQYQQAIDVFNRQWKQQSAIIEDLKKSNGRNNDIWIDNKFSNIIAFCGDRGEGKSSCMASFATILTDGNVRNEAKKAITFPKDKEGNYEILTNDKIEWLDVIDPSFFDDAHNLLELLLGRICEKANRKIKEECEKDCTVLAKYRKLMEQLEKVKHCITTMTPQKDKKIFDSVESISELAAGMQLKNELQTLFKCYLQLVGKECLLICVDDLDLSFKQGYEMAEMLRKYLINPYCVVLASVKVEQLIDIIAAEHQHKVKDTELKWDYCKQVAQKYVAKLLPRGNRVVMPAAEDFCERDLQIADVDGKELFPKEQRMTVKEKVVQMIFQKTGYVFYNTRYLSPIIPMNLRSLRHLLGLLCNLPDARDEQWNDNEVGREAFKDYFFSTWVSQHLLDKDFNFAQQLAEYDDLSTMNAFVVEYFSARVSKMDKKDTTSQNADYTQLYQAITSRENSAANISYGDVMFVLWMINSVTVDVNIQNLIFFIKTVYSMRLYACYNIISEGEDGLYPPLANVQQEVHIHQADKWYAHVNRLQRLVNGAYFTYPQGGLLPRTKEMQYRDRRTISFGVLKQWLKDIKEAYDKENKQLKEDAVLLLRICELMALYTVRTTTYDEKDQDLGSHRSAKIPPHLWQFSITARFAILDFLQPFYSLCNIEYAYRRFDAIMGADEDDAYSLYNIAAATKKSLLHQLYNSKTDDVQWSNQHSLISDSVIRISDVQWAIYDELLRGRDLHKSTDVIHLAYKDIQDLEIKLYPLIRKDYPNGKAWILPFRFLSILSSCWSKDYDIDKEKSKETKEAEYAFIQDRLKELSDLSKESTQESPSSIPDVWARMYNILRKKQWPKKGPQVRSYVSSAANLPSAQRRNLTANLRNVFDDAKEYSFEDINALMPNILAQYYIAKSK